MWINQLTLSEPALRQVLGRLALPGAEAVCPAGVSRLPDRLELLVHHVPAPSTAAATGGDRVAIVGSEYAHRIPGMLREAGRRWSEAPGTAVLALGLGRAAGRAGGMYLAPAGAQPLHRLAVAGSPLVLTRLTGEADGALPDRGAEVWSRTRGALGEATFRRLCGLHVAVVGCGRSGSLAAVALHRLGVGRLTLIDPDVIEPHNLGEMDVVGRGHLGRPKPDALADALGALGLGGVVRPVGRSVLSLTGLAEARAADVLVCCADRPPARLAVGGLAVLYLKPVLDVGAGIFTEAGGRRMGADVRLVLPGGCLLCQGGIAGLDNARRGLLLGPEAPAGDWRAERAGSLRSLNGVAVHLGVRLLEDLAAGRLRHGGWLHLEFSGAGLPVLESREPAAAPACRLCGLTGRGDAGLEQFGRLLGSPERL
jgi:hypothetical protein